MPMMLIAIEENREPVCSGAASMRALEMVRAIFSSVLARSRVMLPLKARRHSEYRAEGLKLNRQDVFPDCPPPELGVEDGREFGVTMNIHALSDWGKKKCLRWCLLAGVLLFTPPLALGHDALGAFVQHAVHLSIGAQQVDLTLDLTFFEEWSARERAAMDADSNGTITRTEQEAYLKKIAPQVCKQIKLRVAGRELPLVPLYEPEIDLFANFKVGPAHHRLRLFLFTDTPLSLHAGDEILVEDRLWPDSKILVTSEAAGRDGCSLASASSGDAAQSQRAEEPRLLRFKCVKQPWAKRDERAPGSGKTLPAPSDSRHNLNP
jgi:hypothetical protein